MLFSQSRIRFPKKLTNCKTECEALIKETPIQLQDREAKEEREALLKEKTDQEAKEKKAQEDAEKASSDANQRT